VSVTHLVRIPSFSFDSRIYEGTATIVYAGVRDADGLPVVGKLVRDDRRDLQTELDVLERLAGPGIVSAIGIFESNEGPTLVQQRFGNSSLAEVLKQGPLAPREVVSIAAQIATVLTRIHGCRFLHRDLKPANILYEASSGRIAVADFGIAIELPVGQHQLAKMDLVGTPAYLSPEQTGRTEAGCDARSDLYSLGVLMYELMVGERPFAASDLAEVVAAHISRSPVAPSERVAAIPEIVSRIVLKLLAKAPQERYQSARGLARDLARCLETWTETNTVPEFELALSDQIRPTTPHRLYGRSRECEVFRAAAARAAKGRPTLLLVTGELGSGRSSFIEQMLQREADSALCTHAAWQSSTERPLSAISTALSRAANELLLREDDEIAELRSSVCERLGKIGGVVLEIAPEWEHILGAQPKLHALDPQEARARLQLGFGRFVQGVAQDRLFVISLENLDLSDAASRSLIESLLEHEDDCGVLIVGSATDTSSLASLRMHQATTELELPALTSQAMTEWMRDLFECEHGLARSLSECLHERTAGNPAAIAQLLDHFLESGWIEREEGRFSWNLEALRATPPPPSLAAHTASRVAKLPEERRLLLAAIVASDDECRDPELAAMLSHDEEAIARDLLVLQREGLIAASPRGGFAAAHTSVGTSAIESVTPDQIAELRGRLAAYLLEHCTDEQLRQDPFRIAKLLHHGSLKLADADHTRAAMLFELAASQAIGLAAYADAAEFFDHGAELLRALGAESGDADAREALFRSEVGLARALMMLGEHDRANEILVELSRRDLEARQTGELFRSLIENHSGVMQRAEAVAAGLEGLARLGYEMPAAPEVNDSIAILMQNEARLRTMSESDHVALEPARDDRVLAAIRIISTMSTPTSLLGRTSLYLFSLETALKLHLEHGHTRYYASLLSVHSMLLHGNLSQFDASRRSYEACLAVQQAKPAPEIDGRTYLVLYYLICPWFFPWQESLAPLAKGIDLAIEAGDPLFAAISASASTALMSMCGYPLERVADAIESWGLIMKADAGVAATSNNLHNIARKLASARPIEQADLDRISNVSRDAGAMRNSGMLNPGLALIIAGHEAQVRVWMEDVRETFPTVNQSQPTVAILWLLEALLGCRAARRGEDEGLELARARLASLKQLGDAARTENHRPAIALIEAEIARCLGEVERASGLYGRAASEARRRQLTHIVGFAMDERSSMLREAGFEDEADLFLREAVIAYRRWNHATRVQQLEALHPSLRSLERSSQTRSRGSSHASQRSVSITTTGPNTTTGSVNETLDLQAVLRVSQEISTQLHASEIVRVVLRGITQNAGAQRVVFVLRTQNAGDVVYGEVLGEDYRLLETPLAEFAELPESVLRRSRRTSEPIVIADASADKTHASDPFVAAHGCRSIAVFPVFRKGKVGGFVLLENRMVAGAFSPRLVELAQALVAQAAISLDNASLYETLEQRVLERTAALNARNAEMRLLFDNVAQGLMLVDRDGVISPERSAILDSWFDAGVPRSLAELFADDPMFDIGWEQLVDGLMPLELCVDQLPEQLELAQRTLAVSWQPILDASEELSRMLVVLSDVTEMLLRQQAEIEQKQLMAIFARLGRDRSGVIEFIQEACALVASLASGELGPDAEKRLLHTVKGNSAIIGLHTLSSLCHELETNLATEERQLTPGERERLRDTWSSIHAQIRGFLEVNTDFMQVRKSDFDALLALLRRENHAATDELELWSLEALDTRFERIAEQARELAARLGKSPLHIEVEAAGIRIEGPSWSGFWSAFIHAVRNAVDHGLEPAEERASTGKGPATLRLRARLCERELTIELADDGRGVAWDKVREMARARGLPADTRDDLVEALFSDGLSTKGCADESSGRGVGMSALRQACVELGGRIELESQPGAGTTWRFVFPAQLGRTPRRSDPS